MAKHTINAYVHYEEPDAWDESNAPKFKVYPFDMTSTGQVLVGKQQIEIEVPDDFNPVLAQIAVLEKKKAEVQRALARELMELDKRISELQAITYEEA